MSAPRVRTIAAVVIDASVQLAVQHGRLISPFDLLDYCIGSPQRCDGCGAALIRDDGSREYVLQTLPRGETLDGRDFMALCPRGRCIALDER